MKTVENVLLVALVVAGPSAILVTNGCAIIGFIIHAAAKRVEARGRHLIADPSAAYLPDAEREVDAMGLNGPALRAADDNGSTKALDAIARKQRAIEDALTAPPKPTGYVMAGRVFPAPEDPEWRALGGNCWSHRKAAVFVGEPYVSVDGVPVVEGAKAAKYANAIQAAKKWDEKREKEKAIARALATLPLAPKDGDA